MTANDSKKAWLRLLGGLKPTPTTTLQTNPKTGHQMSCGHGTILGEQTTINNQALKQLGMTH